MKQVNLRSTTTSRAKTALNKTGLGLGGLDFGCLAYLGWMGWLGWFGGKKLRVTQKSGSEKTAKLDQRGW